MVDEHGNAIFKLGEEEVPHGQEVRVADFLAEHPGPEMVVRWHGHNPDILVVSSATHEVVRRLSINDSPTNVGMEAVYWHGQDKPALLYNGGLLWNVEDQTSAELPGLPPPNGGEVHRMSFYHCIPANVCGDDREELVLWDPTSTALYVYTPAPLDEAAFDRYCPGPRQYNPRLMD